MMNPNSVQSLVMQENFFTATLEDEELDSTQHPQYGVKRELSICPEEEAEGETGYEERLNGIISE